ncbi:MAG: hypothetical protein SR1Q7_00215 [Quinella sp. 1Q7]|nr:hypothetical protein [Quinella sp. 1Q7]
MRHRRRQNLRDGRSHAHGQDGLHLQRLNDAHVTEDKTVSATFDTANHYVFGTEGNYTLATADNVASNNYPELKQVYALTLSDGVTVTGDTVATDSNGNYYAAGEVTLAAKTGYTISDTSLNVTEDTTITATDVWGVSGGADGSAEKPYLISDVAGLQALADYVNGGGNTSNLNFKLTANINLDGVDFAPIGNYDGDTPDSFEGTFDGADFKISNLSISSTGDYVGLFGFVGEGGTIKNVTLENATINGNSSVGGLVGYSNGGSVKDCSVIGGTVTGADKVGGLVGYSGGTVKDCSVIGGTVSSNQYVGGLVGHNNGSVSDNTVGNVTVTATYTGDSACCGGIVGYTSGTVTGNKVSGTVNGDGTLGALVGYNDTNDPINDNYYYGNADAVGYQKDSVTVGTNTRLYKLTVPADVEVSGDNIFTFGGTTYAAGTVTLTTKLGVIYSTENSFTITEDTTITATDHWGVLGGADGSANNPYLISDVAGLQLLATYVNDGKDTTGLNFKLTADINLSGVEFAPIGTISYQFKGTFDGNNSAGYKISNLTVNTPDNNNVGLFGYVGKGGTIQNITLTDVNITGKNNVGGLLGDNEGEVTNCTVSGTVSGNSYVGGLVGLNAFGGRVENNTAITTVNGSNSPVGGVAGSNGSVATNNKFYGNQTDALGRDVVSDSKNTRYYKLTLPDGVTASGNSFTFDGTTYAAGTVILLSTKTGYALNETSIDVAKDTDLSTTTFTTTDVWGVESGANGSTANPYLISDVVGLQLLAAYVNAGNTCAGLNFKLADDIDLSSVENFTAIGNFTNTNNYNPFSGTFDGGDFKISNLKINSTLHYNGLFSYNSGTIKNVTLDNVDISGNGSLGALVGQNDGTIENCTVSGKVNGKGQFVGGLVGDNRGTVSGGTVNNVEVNSSYRIVGGLVGVNNGGTITDGTVNGGKVTKDGNNVGGLVGYNAGTVTGGTVNNVEVSGYRWVGGLTGYNTGGTVTGSKVVATVTATFTATETVYSFVGGVVGQNANSGTVGTSENPNYYHSDKGAVEGADADNNLPIYELTLPDGVTASGALLTYGNKAYVTAGNVTFAGVKTGYVINDVNVTQDTSISATFDTANHYVLADNPTTLATAANTTDYPNLVQVYELTLPSGVTASGDTVATADGKTYATGNVTFTGVKTGYVINDVNVTEDTTVTATLDTENHYVLADDTSTLATAENVGSYPNLKQVYALTLPEGVTAEGDIVATADGKYYAAGNVTFAGVKTGYVIDGVNVTQDTTITATVDAANHYVLADNTSTLATEANTATYPDLIQVYELTLPSGVTVASGDTVATADGKTYAAGEVTLTAAKGYTIQSISVDGSTLDGTTFTVDAATEISAESFKSINGGKGVEVGGTTGDFSAESGVYSITASQENSTVVGNTNNNNVNIAGGGENILTGGGGNDTYTFSAGGGIVTDYGIGSTKDSTGKTLSAPLGSDIVKVSGTVSGVYFDRDASSKKSATFTAIVTYGTGDDTDIIVLQNINKKPTKYSSDPSKAVYQTNDAAAATLKIWDTSGTKQAVLSAAKLKALFRDDNDLDDLIQAKVTYLGDIADGKTPTTNPFEQTAQATFNGGDNG